MRGDCFVEWFSLLVEPAGIRPFHPDKSYSSSYPRPSRYKMHLVFSGIWRPQFCPITREGHVSWVGFLDSRLVYLGPMAALNTTSVNYLVYLPKLETAWVSSLPLMDRYDVYVNSHRIIYRRKGQDINSLWFFVSSLNFLDSLSYFLGNLITVAINGFAVIQKRRERENRIMCICWW